MSVLIPTIIMRLHIHSHILTELRQNVSSSPSAWLIELSYSSRSTRKDIHAKGFQSSSHLPSSFGLIAWSNQVKHWRYTLCFGFTDIAENKVFPGFSWLPILSLGECSSIVATQHNLLQRMSLWFRECRTRAFSASVILCTSVASLRMHYINSPPPPNTNETYI